tara:strand:+ start:27 stop:194 length:168 start_codon:yes stop_codon:yes gene_type:complete
MIRVQIQGTTIFGYVQENYKEVKLPKVAFLDEETKNIRRVNKKLIKNTEQKERYN